MRGAELVEVRTAPAPPARSALAAVHDAQEEVSSHWPGAASSRCRTACRRRLGRLLIGKLFSRRSLGRRGGPAEEEGVERCRNGLGSCPGGQVPTRRPVAERVEGIVARRRQEDAPRGHSRASGPGQRLACAARLDGVVARRTGTPPVPAKPFIMCCEVARRGGAFAWSRR